MYTLISSPRHIVPHDTSSKYGFDSRLFSFYLLSFAPSDLWQHLPGDLVNLAPKYRVKILCSAMPFENFLEPEKKEWGVTLWKHSTSLTVASSNPETAFPGWRTGACKLVHWSKNDLNPRIKTEPVTAGADATFMQLGNRHRLFVVYSTISISVVA